MVYFLLFPHEGRKVPGRLKSSRRFSSSGTPNSQAKGEKSLVRVCEGLSSGSLGAVKREKKRSRRPGKGVKPFRRRTGNVGKLGPRKQVML